MTTISSATIIDQIDASLRNPKATVRTSLDLLETMTNGEVVSVSAGHPFEYVISMAACMTASGLIQSEAVSRRLYPSMAKTQEEAYLHMADDDYIGRFATPAETVLGFLMPLEDVLGRAVPVNDGTGARALVLPRHTSVTHGDYVFTLQYPLVFKVLYNNTLNIYLDTNSKTPTWLPATNSVTWLTSMLDGAKWLMVEVPVQQVKITSQVVQITAHTGYAKTYSFEDEFYYCRAYIKNSSGNWSEIHTTHQEQVYNSNQPTVCLKVLNRSLEVYIPQIYFQNGLIDGSIRIDIYTTKGKLDMDLAVGDVTTPRLKYQDLDNPLTVYSTPFAKFSNITAIARKRVTGGSAALTFAELITRLRTRSAYSEGLPITTNQMSSRLRDRGFELNTALDNATRRQFTASRDVDAPADQTTVTGLGCSIQLAQFTLDDLKINPIIFESTKRATIKPTELFLHGDDGIELLSDEYVAGMRLLAETSPDSIANTVNSLQYHYTPFHYVLDMGLSTFGVRPYYMSSPDVVSRYLFQQNDGLGVNIRSSNYSVEYLADGSGYRILLSLETTASLTALEASVVSILLSYLVPETSTRSWIAGELITPIDPITKRPINDNWVYSFDIKSSFDIDRSHLLDVTTTGYPVGLVQEFDLVYILKDFLPDTATYGDIDTIISRSHIPDQDYNSTYIGATQEKLTISFGKLLSNLWTRTRTVVAPNEYKTYDKDVYSYWEKDVYETDASGVVKFTVSPSGEVIVNKIHSVGDPVLDGSGNHVIAHKKNDVMYDNDGYPVPLKGVYDIAREIDMFFVDGRYYFATDDSTLSYLTTSLDQITEWMETEIEDARKRCIEKTDIYFYPKMTSGMIDVIVGNSQLVRLKAAQTINIVYVLRKEKYKNAEIRDNLTKKTPAMLLAAFNSLQKTNSGILTVNDIKAFVKALVKEDIVDIRLSGFLEDKYEAAMATEVSSVPTIGKKLVTLSNLTLQVQDDVSVDFDVLDSDVIMPYSVTN